LTGPEREAGKAPNQSVPRRIMMDCRLFASNGVTLQGSFVTWGTVLNDRYEILGTDPRLQQMIFPDLNPG